MEMVHASHTVSPKPQQWHGMMYAFECPPFAVFSDVYRIEKTNDESPCYGIHVMANRKFCMYIHNSTKGLLTPIEKKACKYQNVDGNLGTVPHTS